MTPADLDTTARTVYGEARGEQWLGKVAVAWVIRNRATKGGWWGKAPEDVCKKPYQFSCWNGNDPNLDQLRTVTVSSPFFRDCLAAASAVLADLVPDPTGGATHYKVVGLPWPADWGGKRAPLCVIGNHEFFRLAA